MKKPHRPETIWGRVRGMSPPLVLRTMDRADPRWDAYVTAHPDGSVYHSWPFRRVLERAYPHTPVYFYVERAEEVVGVFPAFISGAAPFTRALVSVPLGVGGGILASDPEARDRLQQAARELAMREDLAYVEYKSERAELPGLVIKDDLYFGFTQALLPDEEAQLKLIPRKARAVLREAERSGLSADYNRQDFAEFYDLYAQSLRNLGTPMFPKELFVACLEELPGADLLSVRQQGRVIGSVLNFYFKDRMLPFFAGTAPEARAFGVNNFMYWHMLRTGYERGYRCFDFGRSKIGTGAFSFKKNFGMTPTPLAYQYDLVGVDALPEVNPNNPKYAAAISVWKRLPVGLHARLGPLISTRLP